MTFPKQLIDQGVIETCDFDHKFIKLPDHPRNSSGHAACPYCLSIGLATERANSAKRLEALRDLKRRLDRGGILTHSDFNTLLQQVIDEIEQI